MRSLLTLLLAVALAGVATAQTTTDPATTDPAATDPAATDPATTDPAATDPAAGDGLNDPDAFGDPADDGPSVGAPGDQQNVQPGDQGVNNAVWIALAIAALAVVGVVVAMSRRKHDVRDRDVVRGRP